MPECTTNDDLCQQQYPSSSSPDDNVNLQSKSINRVDDYSTCVALPTGVAGNVPMIVRQNSVGMNSAVDNSALGNISILDAAVPATPLSSLAHCTDQSLVGSASESCRRQDRLCLKSSQRKRRARQMEEASQVEPLLQDNENSSNGRAKIDSSTEPLCGTETKRIGTSSAEMVTLKNGCVGESDLNDDFLPNLIPDPMDDEIHLNKPRNLPDVCASSSQMQNKKLPNPGCSQPMITSYLTPMKKVGITVTRNCTTQVPKMPKDKSKAQKRLQLSDVDAKRNESVIQTRLINDAEMIHDYFNPLPSSILPVPEMNVSPTKSADMSPVTEVTVSPIKEIVSVFAKEAFVRKEGGMTVSRKCTTDLAKIAKNKSKAQKRVTVSRNCTTEVARMAKDKSKAQKRLQLSDIDAKRNENVIQTRLINEGQTIQDALNPLPSSILPIAERNVSRKKSADTSPVTEMTVSPITEIEASVSSVSLGISGSLGLVGNPSKQSTRMSSNFQLPFSPRILKKNLPSTVRKLVLDGRGSFSLLTEIESLLGPLSDSSNDVGESSESLEGDSSDTGLNSASTASCSSYEELSSTFFLHQMEEDTEIDRGILCLF